MANTMQLIWYMNKRLRFIWANDPFLQMFGKSIETLRGETGSMVFPTQLAVDCQRYGRMALGEAKLQQFERHTVLSNGREVALQVTLLPISDADNQVQFMVGIAVNTADQPGIPPDIGTMLREHDLQRQAMFDAGNVSLLDPSGRFMFVSDSFCESTGYTREELIGHTGEMLELAQANPALQAGRQAAFQRGEVWRGEVCKRRKNGELLWLQSTIVPFFEPDGKPYLYFNLNVDITFAKSTAELLLQHNELLEQAVDEHTRELEIAAHMLEDDVEKRRNAEKELRGQQELLQSVLASLGEHIAVIDPDGKIILRNEAWQQFADTGDEPDALHRGMPGDNYLTLCDEQHGPALARQAAAAIREVLSGARPQASIEYNCTHQGEVAHFILRISPWVGVRGGAVLTHIDITERRQMEASHSRLISVAENTSDIIITFDGAGQLVYLNRSGRRLFGMEEGSDTGIRTTTDMVTPESKTMIQQLATRAAREHGMWQGEFTFVAAQGHHVPVSAVMLTQTEDGGNLQLYSCVARDISLIKRTEEELRRRNDDLQELNTKLEQVQSQLLQSEKMASIGQLAAGVAHEINNPIGYVNSNLSSLENYIGDLLALLAVYEGIEQHVPETVRTGLLAAAKKSADIEFLRDDLTALLGESKEGISRVKKIVQDLKDFSRVDSSSEWEFANLHRCLDSTLNIVNNEVKYKASVTREYGELPEVECLPSQLNQVFMNMLVNASHAIVDFGTICIRTGVSDDLVWVEFQDSGQGMTADNMKRIFDPFFTTKPVGKGTGLGLSLSYSIVQKHHGHIEVNSTVGQGTTFRVWLPIHQSEQLLAEPIPFADESPRP